ncbi:ParB/RepB/Spo0J family partition protein [Rummeliibacillus sp. NPDC094406]|uniref:ParB/RepB/Spo0J family partition protein n=1 Tax=Rummeliibacillus sp. NPDC094406 TaxID=3364511 RepID=UPI00380075E2
MAKGLGKGLGALFQDQGLIEADKVTQIAIRDIRVNPYQPRKVFDEEALQELAQSIKEYGILQPIILRRKETKYEIVVGERRFRAAKLANLTEVPAVIRDLNDSQMMELAILENLQREDLTPIEEAEAYHNLMEHLNLTQEELSKRIGKSRPHIANHVRLLTLPKEIQKLVNEGKLTMGHGRTLLGLKNKKQIPIVADKVMKQQLNVRQLEELVHSLNEDVPRETNKKVNRDIFIEEKESQLRDYFGTNVLIKKTKNKGKIEIEFFSEDDLERILELLED